jgi:hypothetical protein
MQAKPISDDEFRDLLCTFGADAFYAAVWPLPSRAAPPARPTWRIR